MQNNFATPEPCPDAAEPQPDAELLSAWRGFLQAHHDLDAACEHLADGGTDEERAPFWRRIKEHQDKIEKLPAHSMAGVAVKLRFLFADQSMSIDAQLSALHGAPLSPALIADMDANDNMLWRLIADVERMGAARPAAKA